MRTHTSSPSLCFTHIQSQYFIKRRICEPNLWSEQQVMAAQGHVPSAYLKTRSLGKQRSHLIPHFPSVAEHESVARVRHWQAHLAKAAALHPRSPVIVNFLVKKAIKIPKIKVQLLDTNKYKTWNMTSKKLQRDATWPWALNKTQNNYRH